MTIAYDDLPAGRLRDAVRRAVAQGDGRPVSPRRRAMSGGSGRASARTPALAERVLATRRARGRRRYLCGACSNAESSYKAAERHADEHGGARIDLDLEAG